MTIALGNGRLFSYQQRPGAASATKTTPTPLESNTPGGAKPKIPRWEPKDWKNEEITTGLEHPPEIVCDTFRVWTYKVALKKKHSLKYRHFVVSVLSIVRQCPGMEMYTHPNLRSVQAVQPGYKCGRLIPKFYVSSTNHSGWDNQKQKKQRRRI